MSWKYTRSSKVCFIPIFRLLQISHSILVDLFSKSKNTCIKALFCCKMTSATCLDDRLSDGEQTEPSKKRQLENNEVTHEEFHVDKKRKSEAENTHLSGGENQAVPSERTGNDLNLNTNIECTDDALEQRDKVCKVEIEVITQHSQESSNKDVNLPRKRKCALLLSYCGAGYNGMQINPGVNTIEEELINALYKTGAITLDCKDNPRKSLLPTINEYLPPEIRVFELVKVTKGFDCKLNCSSRTYEYLLPTFAFAKEYKTTKDYRLTEQKIEEINEVLSIYLGTRNYHNFTSGKKFEDPSAKRYILSFKCNKPFVKDDCEFVVLTIKGQSFVLHQIRKMIGLAVAVIKGVAPRSTFDLIWDKKKVDIPKAPALGLALEMVHFDAYNKKFGSDGFHDSLNWVDSEDEVAQFKAEFIHKHMIDTEIKEHVMMRWLNSLPGHTYSSEGMEEIGTVTKPAPDNDIPSQETPAPVVVQENT